MNIWHNQGLLRAIKEFVKSDINKGDNMNKYVIFYKDCGNGKYWDNKSKINWKIGRLMHGGGPEFDSVGEALDYLDNSLFPNMMEYQADGHVCFDVINYDRTKKMEDREIEYRSIRKWGKIKV